MQFISANALLLVFYFFSTFLTGVPPGENPGQDVNPTESPSEGLGSGSGLVLKNTYSSNHIRPKSIAHSGTGLFFAQNMMYRHSITVFDRNLSVVKTISDRVNLSDFPLDGYRGVVQGSPVETAFTPDGRFAWVSNYKMYGEQFGNPGTDNCQISPRYDNSFIYKISTETFQIESVVEVGCVPKYITVTPDGKTILVSNWCSGDLSVVDVASETEIRRIQLDRYPRGIAVDSKSRYAYVSIMGEDEIAVIRLAEDYPVSWISGVGKTPRHLCIDPNDRFLYATLSREGMVAKIDVVKARVVSKVATGNAARSMTLSPDGQFLYVVNYMDNSLAKVKTEDMSLIETIPTKDKPIGVAFDPSTRSVWVACYTGSVMVFEDKSFHDLRNKVNLMEAGPLPPASTAARDIPSPLVIAPATREKEPDENFYIYKNHEIEDDEDFISTSVTRGNPPASLAEKPAPKTEVPGDDLSHSRNLSGRAQISSLSKIDNINGQVLGFHVIVGSYDQRSNALTRIEKLKNQGIQATVLPTDDGKFRVSCFQFRTRPEAEKAVNDLFLHHKIEAWILEK